MTSARRWAPLAAFLLPTGAWIALNQWAVTDGLRNGARAQNALHAAMQLRQPTRVIPPFDPSWYADTPAQHLAALWPGVLLLVGAALLAVAIRARLRGPMFLLAALSLFAGTIVFAWDTFMLVGAAGSAVGGDVFNSINGPGFDGSAYMRPQSLLWIGAALALAATLAPALLWRASPAAERRLPGVRDLAVAVALAVATAAATAALYATMLPTSTFFWQKTATLAGGVLLASLVVGRGADRRTWALLVAAYASISMSVSEAAGAPEFVRAALVGAALVGIAGLRNVGWDAVRLRVNAAHRPAVAATDG